MKKTLLFLLLTCLSALNLFSQSNFVDKIITVKGDTIHCELVLPPVKSDKLFYWESANWGDLGEPLMKFIPYREVSIVYEGTSCRFYSISTNNELVEMISKGTPQKQPELKNRMMAAVATNYKTGNMIPVLELDYVRYQWKNTGVGLTADFTMYDVADYYQIFGYTVGETVTDIRLFVGLKASQRFYMYNTNSFFHMDLAVGYQYMERLKSKYSELPSYSNFAFVATVGWEFLLSRKSGAALDFSLRLHNSEFGASLGFKFGK